LEPLPRTVLAAVVALDANTDCWLPNMLVSNAPRPPHSPYRPPSATTERLQRLSSTSASARANRRRKAAQPSQAAAAGGRPGSRCGPTRRIDALLGGRARAAALFSALYEQVGAPWRAGGCMLACPTGDGRAVVGGRYDRCGHSTFASKLAVWGVLALCWGILALCSRWQLGQRPIYIRGEAGCASLRGNRPRALCAGVVVKLYCHA
jgi:hypothetical protein